MKIFENKHFKRIIFLISFIMACILMFMVYQVQLIPDMYMIIIGVILLLMLVGEYFLIFAKNASRKRTLIGQILSLFLSCVLMLGSFGLYKTSYAVNLLTSQSFQTRAISIIVLEDSSIKNEHQIPKHQLGYVSRIDEDTMKYAVDEISSHLGKINLQDSQDIATLVNALYNKKVDAIILDEAFRSLVEQDHKNFSQDTRVVYQITQNEDLVSAKNVDVTQKPFLVYISGNDEYGQLSAVSRSDVNMLAAINPVTSQILLVSIPRDLYHPLHRNGQYDKFTHSGIYGLQESIDTLQDIVHEDINYYVRMNFTSFINIVDALGGVTVYSPNEFVTVKGNYQIHKGNNELDAKQALSFVRERKAFLDGDFERGRNQQRMISAIVKKVCSPAILTSFAPVLDTVSQSIETNLSNKEINALVQMQLSKMPSWDIQNYQISGEPSSQPCYSSGGRNASVIIPDELSIRQATEYIDSIMQGKKVDIKNSKGE